MKVWLTPYDETLFQMDWPDGWRIPVAGEVILCDEGQYLVRSVQWEFEDGEFNVNLRCDG